jgi:hypothetical protein
MHWVLSISMLLYAAGVRAEEDPAEPVDLAFLEYLGTLVFAGDGWVGPQDMVVPLDSTATGEGAAATGKDAATTEEKRVPYEDAFERDLAEEPGDAG